MSCWLWTKSRSTRRRSCHSSGVGSRGVGVSRGAGAERERQRLHTARKASEAMAKSLYCDNALPALREVTVTESATRNAL